MYVSVQSNLVIKGLLNLIGRVCVQSNLVIKGLFHQAQKTGIVIGFNVDYFDFQQIMILSPLLYFLNNIRKTTVKQRKQCISC